MRPRVDRVIVCLLRTDMMNTEKDDHDDLLMP